MSKDTLFEEYPKRIWSTPSYYSGFDPVGHIVLFTRDRDSHPILHHNYEVALKNLTDKANELGLPSNNELVYDWRASHWAVGWVEYLMISPEAPQELRVLGKELLDDAQDNVVLDHELYDEKMHEGTIDFIDNMDDEELSELKKDFSSDQDLYWYIRETYLEA